jgi:hypothetical protein
MTYILSKAIRPPSFSGSRIQNNIIQTPSGNVLLRYSSAQLRGMTKCVTNIRLVAGAECIVAQFW